MSPLAVARLLTADFATSKYTEPPISGLSLTIFVKSSRLNIPYFNGVVALTFAVLMALSSTRENSPIPNAGASTTKTVGSVSGLDSGLGSVVSNLIIGLE